MINKLSAILKQSTFRSSMIMLVLRALGMVLAYVSIILISRIFGAETYGRFSLILTTTQFMSLIASLGLPFALVKLTSDVNFFYNNTPKNNYLFNAFKVVLASGIIVSIIIYALSKTLAESLFKDVQMVPYFKALAVFFLFVVMHKFLVEFVKGKKRFISYGVLIYVLPYFLFLLIFGTFYFSDLETKERTIYLSYFGPFLFLTIPLIFYLPKKGLKTSNKFSYNSLFSLSFPMLFSAAFIFISNWTDVFMLGAMVSKAELGIYNASYKIATIGLIIINAINAVLAPKIATLYSQDDLKGIKSEVKKGTKIISYLTLPLIIIIIIFKRELLSFFGTEFIKGEITLIIFSLGLLFNAFSGSVGQVLNMTNYQKELRNFTILSTLINIILNYVLIIKFGIIGAAIATVTSSLLLNLMCLTFIKRKFGFIAFFGLSK